MNPFQDSSSGYQAFTADAPATGERPPKQQRMKFVAGAGIMAVTLISLCAAAFAPKNAGGMLGTKMALRQSAASLRTRPAIQLKAPVRHQMPTVSRCVSSHALMTPSSASQGAFSKTYRSVSEANNRQVSANSLFGLGLPELVVIGGIAALIFGPSKLPELGKSLGATAKSLGSAVKEFNEELKDELNEEKEGEKAADAMATKKEEPKE
eukprot:CAMPEP_0114514470 /NCGR_PEP_ID=MMETSP0109-20121206/16173_1 /TAXON_ID=29199 /ORGANISM="Chlorarachnion reptans, Strain CCCM449" /LENGTH=208 /DNA_ID=CAMNT_0001694517 /DNA_START=186 /DNA_END=812 /DNA_ORIENTATION=+